MVRRLKNGGPAACVYKSFFNEGSPPVHSLEVILRAKAL